MLSLLALALFIISLGALISLKLLTNAEVTSFAEMISAVVTAGTAVAVPLLRKLDSAEAAPPNLSLTAADALAKSLTDQWKHVANQRRLNHEQVIQIRWKWPDAGISGTMESVVNPPDRTFPPLPGAKQVTAEELRAGQLDDLFPVYAGLRSGRFVIIGGPGMGKSAAGIRLLLDALQHRQEIKDDKERQRVPVPVLLTAHGWKPGNNGQTLGQWLAARLKTDLASLLPGAGPEIATELVHDGKVSLILDGLDEMEEGLLTHALEEFDGELTFRLVLLSRFDEFDKATGLGGGLHVRGAAVLELQPVSGPIAADYLSSAFAPGYAPLQSLLDHLRGQPGSAVTEALNSPLMLSLLFTMFRHWSKNKHTDEELSINIRDLMDSRKYPKPEVVKTYLLNMVLPLAYGDRRRGAYDGRPTGEGSLTYYRYEQAEKWLGYIALKMKEDRTSDLEWWQLHNWTEHKLPRILITMFAIGIPTTFGVWFVFNSSQVKSLGLLIGPAMGLIVGISVGLFTEREKPTGGHPAERWQERGWGRRFIAWFNSSMFNAPVGLLAGIVTGVAVGAVINPSGGWLALAAGFAVGLFCCFASGLASGVGAADRGAGRGASNSGVKRMLSRFSPLVAVACGLPVAAAISFAPQPPKGAPWATSLPETGVAFGISLAIAFGLLGGFSKPEDGASVPSNPTDSLRRDFRESLEVGLPFGLAIGLVGGIGIAGSTGWLKGLPVGVVIGAVGVLVAGVAVSSRWRTMLVFLQLWSRGRAPLMGMRFLRDAERREVLRNAGPVYQFRHALLRDKLAEDSAKNHSPAPARRHNPDHEATIARTR
jgi:hypothetical protein